MEAVPRLPMLHFDLKVTTEATSFVNLKRVSGESGSRYGIFILSSFLWEFPFFQLIVTSHNMMFCALNKTKNSINKELICFYWFVRDWLEVMNLCGCAEHQNVTTANAMLIKLEFFLLLVGVPKRYPDIKKLIIIFNLWLHVIISEL